MNDDRLNRMEEMLGTLIKMVGENNSKLGTVESRLGTIEADVQDIKINVNELIQGQERQDRILERLSVKSAETESYIEDFKRKL